MCEHFGCITPVDSVSLPLSVLAVVLVLLWLARRRLRS